MIGSIFTRCLSACLKQRVSQSRWDFLSLFAIASPFYPLALAATFLPFVGLIKTTVGCENFRALTGIRFNAVEHFADSFGVAYIALVFGVRQNDAVIIDCQTHQAAELAGFVGFAFFDDRYFRFMQGIQPLGGL